MKTLEEIKNTPNLMIIKTGLDGGIGELQLLGHRYGSVIWSFGGGWEHVSVSPEKSKQIPRWEEMCKIKELFFEDDETVIQYIMAKKDNINLKEDCLHLWRPTE